MVIRLTRKRFIKPRICPDCKRFTLIAKHYLENRCVKCSRKKNNRRARFRPSAKKYKSGYWKVQKQCVARGYCQLCGATDNLTAHHVGGGSDKPLTCLCDTCHQAYERWNLKRKLRLWA